MKSIVTISFILIHLFSTTALGELFKLPMVVHHYFEHEDGHDHESIFHFLKEHYAELHATLNHHHSDHHKHLPFKMTDRGFLTYNISLVPNTSIISEPIAFNIIPIITLRKNPSTYSHFLADIWQPPRA